MPCKENIKQQLTSIIQKESNAGFSMPLDKAIQLAKEDTTAGKTEKHHKGN